MCVLERDTGRVENLEDKGKDLPLPVLTNYNKVRSHEKRCSRKKKIWTSLNPLTNHAIIGFYLQGFWEYQITWNAWQCFVNGRCYKIQVLNCIEILNKTHDSFVIKTLHLKTLGKIVSFMWGKIMI